MWRKFKPYAARRQGVDWHPPHRLYGILTPAATMSFAQISCALTHSVSAGHCFRPIYLTVICSENVCEKERWGTDGEFGKPFHNSRGSPAPPCSYTAPTSPVCAWAHQPTSLFIWRSFHSKRAIVKLFTISQNQQPNK